MKTTARQKTLLHKSWKQHLGKAACRPDRLAVRSFKFREHWTDWKTKWSSMIVFSIIQKSMPMIRFTFFFVFFAVFLVFSLFFAFLGGFQKVSQGRPYSNGFYWSKFPCLCPFSLPCYSVIAVTKFFWTEVDVL